MGWPPRSEMEARFDRDVVHLVWELSLRCNLNCPYCFGHRSDGPVDCALRRLGVASVAQVIMAALGERRVYFDMTGGEPMLVDELVELADLLPPDKAHFRIQTNGTVYRKLRPAHINLAYQPLSMNHRQVGTWWKHLEEYLRDGHAVTVQFIALPDRLDELGELVARARRVLPHEAVYVRYLQGQYQGRSLPADYRLDDLARIRPLMGVRSVEEELCRLGVLNFAGRRCRAGSELAVIFGSGDVYRCTGSQAAGQDRLGNLETGFRLHEERSEPCRYPCSCVFQGLWYSLNV